MKKLSIILLLVFALPSLAIANTYMAASCSQADVQSAVNAAIDGDTINIPFGTCTWSSAITIGKPLSIIGAGSGTDGTKLVASGTMSNGFFEITGITSTTLMRISGFYFEMTDWTPETAIYVHSVVADNIRIDHNTFNQGSKPILFYNPKGLIDNNYFYNANLTIEYSAGSDANANASWVSMAAGTADALFVEDNHFIDDANYLKTYTNERVGSFNGGKLVVRYNTFSSYNIPDAAGTVTPIMTHGSAGAGAPGGYWQIGNGARRGQSVVEIYNNVMEGKRIDFPASVRGSANLIHHNTVTTPGGLIRIILAEEESNVGNNWSPPRLAWPAEDQVHNTFIWENYENGNSMQDDTHVVATPSNSYCTASETPYKCCTGNGTGTCAFIVKDRDYFLHEPQSSGGSESFVCKSGVTQCNGASDTYPTDGTLYPTLGTMIFSAVGPNAYYGYTPYTYPHPLRGGGAGADPPLTVTVSGTGMGTVTSSPSGINCGSTCSAGYNIGTVVTLTASPSGGSTFTGWGGACAGTGVCVVTVDAVKSVTGTFTALTVPPSPTNLSINAITSSQITLSWTDSSGNESGFKIERCSGSSCSNFVQMASVAANVNIYSDSGLPAGTAYSYRVRAYNSAGYSGYSNTASASTLSTSSSPAAPSNSTVTASPTSASSPPAAPSNLAAMAVSSTQLRLRWNDNSKNEVGFKIQRCSGQSCSNFTQIASVAAGIRTYTDTRLSRNTQYTYRVQSYNAAGSSQYSNTASARTH